MDHSQQQPPNSGLLSPWSPTPVTPQAPRSPLLRQASASTLHSPSSVTDLHRRYDSTLLTSPTPSEAVQSQAVISKAYRTDLATRFPDVDEVELELTEVASSLEPDSAKTLSDSPFHDSQAWVKSPTFQKGGDKYRIDEERAGDLRNTGHMGGGEAYTTEKEHPQPYHPPRPSTRLLYSPLNKSDHLFLVLPCILLTVVGALIPMYMTILIGDAFGTFAVYPSTPSDATSEDKSYLISQMSKYCAILGGIGAGGWFVFFLSTALWVRIGERVAYRLRKRVYDSVMARGMEWFDLGMGLKAEDLEDENMEGVKDESQENVGAGGLMAKFTRETDDVRIGCGMHFGEMLQSILTFLSCFILSMIKSWNLTLVTLSAIPAVVIVQSVTQMLVAPRFEAERRALAEASTNIERATGAIAMVKAFNAQEIENERFKKRANQAKGNYISQSAIWAFANAGSHFLLMTMFIGGFWYGGKLVREGKLSPAAVMTVFWASLLAGASLQSFIPHMMFVTRGKQSMSSLMAVIEAPAPVKSEIRIRPKTSFETLRSPTSPVTPTTPKKSLKSWKKSKPMSKTSHLALRQIRPTGAKGEFELRNITFAYPSRPETLALDNVSLFLPAGETTFIVGGSGSGKSTIAQLLLRLYQPDHGAISLDDQDLQFLDFNFTREHISAVQQGCIMFDRSVHENVAMGLAGLSKRKPEDATREQVVDACKLALMHEFISGLPEGYETKLGAKGASLSGGQRQRLAIARLRMRDPTVLILDEATSALDATSRILVFEAIKKWRKNRTTIVITHDLSQIQSDDFVYLMKEGRIVEQGFRSDLTARLGSEFGKMASLQAQKPLEPEDRDPWAGGEEIELLDDEGPTQSRLLGGARPLSRQSIRPLSRQSLRPVSRQSFTGNNGYSTYLDLLSDYQRATIFRSGSDKRTSVNLALPHKRMSHRHSMIGRPNRKSTASSVEILRPASSLDAKRLAEDRDEVDFIDILEKKADMEPRFTPSPRLRERKQWDSSSDEEMSIQIRINGEDMPPSPTTSTTVFVPPSLNPPGIFRLFIDHFPRMPKKWLGALGLIGAIGHGILTPFWSSQISLLMVSVTSGGSTTAYVASLSYIILGLSVADAFALGGQYYFMERMAAEWVYKLRGNAYSLITTQTQSWFDRPENIPARLVQLLIKDADDMRQLVSSIVGKLVIVVVMVVTGIAWAMSIDWRLTLVGMALIPIFGIIMVFESWILGILEAANKLAREQIARTFYESVANVRGIRAMALDDTFGVKFATELDDALLSGNKAALGTGAGSGTATVLPYFIQALMLYLSAVFLTKGFFTLSQMFQVYSLILFSVTFASQMLDFVPTMAKTRMAIADFDRVNGLSDRTEELEGDLRYPITGDIRFDKVSFSYPTRSDVPILNAIDLELRGGECVAIVGPSGSGKSTIAALLQRLYEPGSGKIRVDRFDLAQADVRWLRDHIAVVSQSPNLFDATVAENIAYGTTGVPQFEIENAAKAANVHDFIMSLPNGYDTNLGENASLISGGQAQRLQLARALVRKAGILILDECTSALDPANQQAVLDTIMRVKHNKTTIFITHKADVMRRCDRVLCLGNGKIAEQGSYDQLMARRGVFAQLMQAGEWK